MTIREKFLQFESPQISLDGKTFISNEEDKNHMN